ncbi:MAG: alkaline phytoceramidase [Betaproteobacteria bacterium]|nr:alkaline phytoceramidase [Betaproteobacteria bacterium]
MVLYRWLATWSPLARQRLVGALLGLGIIAAIIAGPLQLPGYINFADSRDCLGVPNFGNVASNLGFLLVGLYGLWRLQMPRAPAFGENFEVLVYRCLFSGVVLTAMGSAYFHWAPNDARLFWDRLPMTVVLMSLLCATFAERISLAFARAWFVPLLILGPAAALHWRWTVSMGAEDLRVYGLAQFLTLLMVVVLHAFPSRYRCAPWVLWGLAIYGLAKFFEVNDVNTLLLTGGAISGHSVKHLVAALSLLCIALSLDRRVVAPDTHLPSIPPATGR